MANHSGSHSQTTNNSNSASRPMSSSMGTESDYFSDSEVHAVVESAPASASVSKPPIDGQYSNMETVMETDCLLENTDAIKAALTAKFNPSHKLYPQDISNLLDSKSENLHQDILRIMVQYLYDEGFNTSALTLLNEASVRVHQRDEKHAALVKLHSLVLSGEWRDVEKLCTKNLVKSYKTFLYSCLKQEYLELISTGDMHKAFDLLTRRLKPLESLSKTDTEFRDLCYLLSARDLRDVPVHISGWKGTQHGREQLAEELQSLMDFEEIVRDGRSYVPPNRLMTLMRQAVAYQIGSSRYMSERTPQVSTLLENYETIILPDTCHKTFLGHTDNIKSVTFLGENGDYIASGSSDSTIKIWSIDTGLVDKTLVGHSSRVWSVASNKTGDKLASAGADGTVKIWDLSSISGNRSGDILHDFNTSFNNSHDVSSGKDVYSVRFHPGGAHVAASGYDRVIRLYDLHHGALVKTFNGHKLPVTKSVFTPVGNLIVSGSKDNTIRFWDIASGLCIRTISSHLGEVTSVELNNNGTLLLSSSKDNSNRLWDVRMATPIRKFKGHQNTSKNFIGGVFLNETFVCSGSEDGIVYIWDIGQGEIVQRLNSHNGIVYGACWNSKRSSLATCSDDKTIKTWHYNKEGLMQE